MSYRGFHQGYGRKPRGRGLFRGFRGSRRPNDRNNWKSDTKPVKGLIEKDIGVTEYISDHEGFTGIIKSR